MASFEALFARFRAPVERAISKIKADFWSAPIVLPVESLQTSWEGIAKEQQLPVLPADYIRSFKGPAVHPEGWKSQMGSCLSGRTCGLYCKCGGILAPPILESYTEDILFPDCLSGRNSCHGRCKCHGGKGFSRINRERFIPGPLCSECHGTGIKEVPEELLFLRKAARSSRKNFSKVRQIDVPDSILMYGKNFWDMQCRLTSGMNNVQQPAPTFTEWLQALAKAYLAPEGHFPNVHRYRGIGAYDEQFGGPMGFGMLPVCSCCIERVNRWYAAKYHPEIPYEVNWWDDLIKPRMGNPIHKIERNRRPNSLECTSYPPIPQVGDEFERFLYACQCMKLAADLEQCVDEFEDAQEEFEEEFYCNNNQMLRQELLKADAKTVHRAILLRKRRPSIKTSIFSMRGSVQPYGEEFNVALRRELGNFLRNLPSMKMESEEVENLQDHVENKQGGEILTTPEFLRILKDKKREVRNKEFVDSTQGKLLRAKDFSLSKHDVFLANSILSGLRKSKIIERFAGKCATSTKITVDLTNKEEVVRYAPKALASIGDNAGYRQTFNVLNRPQYDSLNKLAEAGWKEAKSVVLNLHLRSYLPQQMNAYAFCVIMWGHSSDATEAALSGSFVYLGDGEATMLQLPLLCEYVGSSLQDFDAYKRSLVLSTIFPEFSGIADGKAMFGITSIEFTEYMSSSHAGITHEKDSWDAMLRAHSEEKKRFIAGFNVVDTIEKGNANPFSFPEFDMKSIPRHQAVVRTFEDQDVTPILQRNRSLKIKTFGSFRAGHIPVNFLDATAGSSHTCTRTSISDNAGRKISGDFRSPDTFVFNQLITIPSAVTKGQVLAGIDVLANARATMSGFFVRWLRKGYVDTNLRLVCHLPRATFAGLSFFLLVDGVGYLAKDSPTTLNESVVLSYPLHLVTTSNSATYSFDLDWHRYVGQVPFVEENAFLKPTIFVVACVSSALAMSTKIEFYIEAQSYGEEIPRTLAPVENMTYPFREQCLEDLDLFLAPVRIGLGERKVTTFPISFAKPSKEGNGMWYSHAAARLAHYQGVGGILHGTIYIVGSSLVASKLRISMWSKEQHIQHQSMNVYVDTDEGMQFSLQIKDAFYASSVYGDSGAILQVTPLCTPMSPNAVKAPFDMILHLKGFTPDLPLCRTINFTQRFGWFVVTPVTTTQALKMKIWPVSNHLESNDLEVTGYTNAFLQMCATSTMHFGSVILHFSWTLFGGTTNAATAKGVVTITEGFGPEDENFRGHCRNFSIFEGKATVPLELGTFAGPTPLQKLDFKYRNWVRFATHAGKSISSVFVAIEVLPGFKFYGRTGSPKMAIEGTTIPPVVANQSSSAADDDIGDQYAAALGRGRGRGSRPSPNPVRE